MTMHSDDAPPTVDRLLAETAWVRALARTLVVDPGTADDIAQDAAVLALTRPPRTAVRGWLRRVVTNLASNARRGAARRDARERVNARPEAREAAAETVARWEIRRQVVEAVLALEEPYRSTILLRFFDGLTAADAAARLRVPLETVRTRTKRGVEKLRARLAHLDDGRGRRGVAVLLLLAHREADVAGKVTAAAIGKGIAMASAPKVAGVVVLLAMAGVATWAVVTTSRPAAPSRDGIVAHAAAPPRVRRAPDAASTVAAAALPDGVDLSTCDRDRDLFGEVVSIDGRRVAGAAVQVIRQKPLGRLIRTAGFLDPMTVSETTKSGFDGTFALRLAPRECVGLRVGAAGFATWESWYRQAGERLRVTLSPALTLTVTVHSYDGAPVGGALVYVAAEGPLDAHPFGSRHVTTGADGLARIANLARGAKAFLYVTPAAHPPSSQSLVLADAAEQTLEIVLPKGRSVRGSVTDRATGAGLAGAVVTMNGSVDPAATTDTGGRFEVADAPADAGTSLAATAFGHLRTSIRLGANDDDVRIALGPAGRITGRVVDPEGRPVAGADVVAAGTFGPVDANGGERSNGGATTGEDGRFVVDGLAPGTAHAVRVQAAGWGRAVRQTTTAATDPWTTDVGDVRLAAPLTVSGVVVDADGRPVPRLDVVLTTAGNPRDDLLRDHRWSDDLGRFAFAALPAGEVLLTAQPQPDSAAGRETVSVTVTASRDPSPVTIHLGGDPKKLKARIPVKVRVTDESGNPVAGVQMQLLYVANGATPSVVSGADGSAEFAAEAEPANVWVILDAGQARTYLRPEVRVRPGQREFRIALQRGRTVSGRMLFDDGEVVKGGGLTAWAGAIRVGWGTSDNDGNFAFAVPAGTKVDLEGTPQDLPRVRSRSAGELRGVESGAEDLVIPVVRDPASRTIDVEVVDDEGTPVVQAMVATEFHGRDWDHQPTGTTGADGRCRIDALPRGPVLVSATIYDRAAGYNRYWTPQPVRVRAGEDSVKIVVTKARAVSGRVVAEDGSPVAGAVVHASPNVALQGSMNIAGPDGRFTILVPPDSQRPFVVTGNPLPLDPAKPLSGWDLVDADDRELEIVVHPVPAR